MMPVIFADSNIGRPLFLIQGTRVKFSVKAGNGCKIIGTMADCLPRGSLMWTREDVASFDSTNFFSWAKVFIQDVQDLTVGGRKVLAAARRLQVPHYIQVS